MDQPETTELPSADPGDYPTYGTWFDALRIRGDIERQRQARWTANYDERHAMQHYERNDGDV